MKFFILSTMFISTEVFAWGATGHRVVGEIAQKYLNVKTHTAINKILKGQTLSRVSTWPDEIKSDPENYKYTFNWHYTDWPDESHDHDETNSSGKLMTSIDEQLKILKDPTADQAKKEFALKFIVHLIGDLHMPLHVGNGTDQGGNACKVLFHRQPTNLHALWDEGMINFTKLSFTEMTRYVMEGKQNKIKEWMSGTPLDWARESKEIRATVYPSNVSDSKAPQSAKTYCLLNADVAPELMPRLGYEYSYKFMPVVEQRLFQAGLRLAFLLNQHL